MKYLSNIVLWSAFIGSIIGLNRYSAQAFTPLSLTQAFNNPTPEFRDEFASSVSISGTKALIGSPGDNTGGFRAGSAYLFDTETGNLLQTFNNPNSEADSDEFGFSVSIDGTNALIGAPFDGSGGSGVQTGKAYLFDTETGNLLHTFNNPSGFSDGQFGFSVSIDGTNALIGANADGAITSGSAYLFDIETGNLLQTFRNPNPTTETLGNSVSLDGTNALIGALNNDTGALNAGVAYLFDTVTGDILHTFNNPTPEDNESFGLSVSLSSVNALIGSGFDNTELGFMGSAYLFNTITGNLIHTFTQESDDFGSSVSISDTNILIGARHDDTGATNAGSAYLFDAVTGSLLQTINNPDPQTNDRFGGSVSITRTNVLIGAFSDDTGAMETGIAYLYQQENVTEPPKQVPEYHSVLGFFLLTGLGILVKKG